MLWRFALRRLFKTMHAATCLLHVALCVCVACCIMCAAWVHRAWCTVALWQVGALASLQELDLSSNLIEAIPPFMYRIQSG